MSVSVLVHGPLACFTRPEAKVERMTYPVMTPSAARGILEAILYKPQFRWRIHRIHVLKEIKFIGLRRNEVQGKISTRNAQQWMQGKGEPEPLFADAMGREQGGEGEGRTQRNTVALKDVAYVIEADAEVCAGNGDAPAKYHEMFERRVEKGQCFAQPVLGCREFAAYFEPVMAGLQAVKKVNRDRDLGLMLYDVFDLDAQNDGYAAPFVTLFKASLRADVLEVEDWASVKTRHLTGGGHA